jgi:hypothetical protein
MSRPGANYWKNATAEDPVANSHPPLYAGLNTRETAILNYVEEIGTAREWTSSTAYIQGKLVTNSGHTYIAVTSHTSGSTFSSDLASVRWLLLPVTKVDVGLSNVDNTSDVNKPVSSATTTQLALRQLLSEKDQNSGYAGLNSSGRVPVARLASGTPDGTKFVRDDGVLATPSGTGGGGALPSNKRIITASTATAVSGDVMMCDTTSNIITITMPTSGVVIVQKTNSGDNPLRVNAAGGGTINEVSVAPHLEMSGDQTLVILGSVANHEWLIEAAFPATGADGNTILSGTAAPSGGVDGDFYIQNPATAPVLYGPKASGSWPGSGVSLTGGGGFYQTVAVGGTDQTQRAKVNLIAGTNVTITPADNSGSGRTDVTIAASGGSTLAAADGGSASSTYGAAEFIDGGPA